LLKSLEGVGVTFQNLLLQIEANAPVSLAVISREQFWAHYPVEVQVDPFQRSFSRWFSRYAAEMRENLLRCADSEKLDHNAGGLSDGEFQELHGQYPWDFTNSILESAGLRFRINKPSVQYGGTFHAQLTDNATQKTV
jgi:hypothetical protein